MDYNTERNKLMMPEYGRSVQQMVEHCKTLKDKEKRMQCANSIIMTMANIVEHTADKEDFKKKLWNHLAAIANYELDIDYPVDIERVDDENARPEKIDYPQKRIRKRNYGSIVESFAGHLAEMDDAAKSEQLSLLIANHMKRDLSNWSVDSMSDSKVVEDLAQFTNGKIQIDLNRNQLISDGELLSSRISTSVKKKKKK
ncbi:MAG: DUF4290 domain-containing protein [Prevotellaceae bacterium]|nr:DUF4290 domain-containing protein [Candidatus Minthosoma caballi]